MMSGFNKNNSQTNSLDFEFDRLLKQKPTKDADYYQISLFADEHGMFGYDVTTHWVGWSDIDKLIEIREASLIIPEAILKAFKVMNEPALVINNERDLIIFLCYLGGNSIIEKSLLEKYLSHVIKPTENVFIYDKGFIDKSTLNKEVFNRAANPKLRMKILSRDNRRCKICGASPQNNEHVELHLHHITPYSQGGLTNENNLITLCHTCHKGLEPHIDYSLYSAINVSSVYLKKKSDEPYLKKINRNIKFLTKEYELRNH